MEVSLLIVEDELLIAFHLRTLIEQAGYRVTEIASDPVEALECARADRPDLVLMDVRLAGGTSGVDAARTLYEELGVRSIMVSANLDADIRERTKALRPLGYLGKPFMAQEVIAMLDDAIEQLRERA